jgi:hypothetical protein
MSSLLERYNNNEEKILDNYYCYGSKYTAWDKMDVDRLVIEAFESGDINLLEQEYLGIVETVDAAETWEV